MVKIGGAIINSMGNKEQEIRDNIRRKKEIRYTKENSEDKS